VSSSPSPKPVSEYSDHGPGPNAVDPTQTTTLRRRYAQRLRGAWEPIKTEVRAGVRDRDVFGLEADALADADEVPPYRFRSNDSKNAAFIRWLREQIRNGPLEVVSRGDNEFIRSSYRRGLTHADKELNAAGLDVSVTGEGISAPKVLNQGVHRSQLRRLFTRNYENLENIGADAAAAVREELAEGLARGENPRKIARFINDRVDAVGRHRSTVLARTEVINSFSEATLNRFEQFSAGSVTVRSEWLATDDPRTCPICETLDGRTFTIEEARSSTFTYEPTADEPASIGGEYPVKPPAHPQCRCCLVGVTT
jgi:SPP1 gp7 family putative phage head morphogenesis protein